MRASCIRRPAGAWCSTTICSAPSIRRSGPRRSRSTAHRSRWMRGILAVRHVRADGHWRVIWVTARPTFIRLDSFYRFSDPGRMIAWTAGDTINGGLVVDAADPDRRHAGAAGFRLRPDLVTMPIANLGGTAAVPSTVDLYINNTRIFTRGSGNRPICADQHPAGHRRRQCPDGDPRLVRTRNDNQRPVLRFGQSAGPRVEQLVGGSRPAAHRLRIDHRYLCRATGRLGDLAAGHHELVHRGGPCRRRQRRCERRIGEAARTGTFGVATAALAGSTFAGRAPVPAEACGALAGACRPRSRLKPTWPGSV